MTPDICARCEREDETVESTQISSGRDYPGTGGGMGPAEEAPLCETCRDELFPEPEVADVECADCGEVIEDHRLDDPPLHSGCSF